MKHLDSPIEQCFRVLLGKGHQHASKCFEGGFIGVDFGFDFSLESELPEKWRDFNRKFIPYWLTKNPGKSKVTAGLACGMTHTVSKGIKSGAFVLSPNGAGSYRIGRVISDYQFVEGDALPHRRKVEWFDRVVARSEMSDGLRRSAGTPQTVVNLTRHMEEIASLLQSEPATPLGAAWFDGIDITAESGLRRVVADAGLDWGEVHEAAEATDWEDTLAANLSTMLEEDLWGVPSFRVTGGSNDTAFACWGQDRIWRVEKEIAKRA